MIYALICAALLSTNFTPLSVKPTAPGSLGAKLAAKAAAIAPLPKPAFFAVTAYDIHGIESDKSAEFATALSGGSNSVTLGWSDSDPSVVGYRLYWGTNSGNYLWTADAGSATVHTIPQVFPIAPLVPVYSAVYGQSATNLSGPYSDLSPTPLARLTNGLGQTTFYRLRAFSSTNSADLGTNNPAQ